MTAAWRLAKAKVLWEVRKRMAYVEYAFERRRLLAYLERSMRTLSIETTNICNADCVFCAYQHQTRPTGTMDPALFRKLIDEFSEIGGGELGLTPTVGDPLVDKHLVERIAYARAKPNVTTIGMYSNMIGLDRVGLAALLESGVTSIVVSTSGFDADMYRRVYRSPMYAQMLENVKRFAAANNAAGRPIDFQIDMRVDRPVSEVFGYPDHAPVAAVVGADKISVKFRYDNWAGLITQDQLTGNMRLRRALTVKAAPCSELYTGPIVYWDGRVGACGCRDVDAKELMIGDATRQHLGEIWFGGEIRRLRKEFTTGAIKPICRTCTHYNSVATVLMRKDRLEGLYRSNGIGS